MTRARFAVLVLATSLLAACGGPAVPPAMNYATIRGRAYDSATNAAVPGVQVVVDTILTATTGPDGTYRIGNVPIGQYSLVVQAPSGYSAPNQPGYNGSVAAGETASIDIPLTRQ